LKTYIALFRGINVVGRNKLPMKQLVSILEGLGLKDVVTYIQSGNAVFRSRASDASRLATKIGAAVEKARGFRPDVMLLEPSELETAMNANPFREGEAEPNKLHLYFLASAPEKPDLAALQDIASARERFSLAGKVFYLHAPDGIGRSKLAARVEKSLGVSATARNWRTVVKVAEMAGGG
jgi:uncharacterized protein (DUF1697 family)